MDSFLSVKAPAKINLGLAVLRRRPDGYHDLSTVMQQVSLVDTLLLEPRRRPGWAFYCSDPALEDKDNLVCRAAALLEKKAGGAVRGVKITLLKNIPVQAGLAGGSSDAAAALLALNRYWRLGLGTEELMSLGAQLGSDVPFCILGGTALAEGRGERLTPLRPLPFFWVVLALPHGLAISTVEAYRCCQPGGEMPPVERLVEAINRGSREEIREWFVRGAVNSLEAAVLPRHPAVKALKKRFKELGLAPAMSGSGPAVFALADRWLEARAAARALQEEGYRAFLCWTVLSKQRKEAAGDV